MQQNFMQSIAKIQEKLKKRKKKNLKLHVLEIELLKMQLGNLKS